MTNLDRINALHTDAYERAKGDREVGMSILAQSLFWALEAAREAEEVGDELRREIQRLRDALISIAHIGDPVLGTGVSPRAQEIARCALGWPAT